MDVNKAPRAYGFRGLCLEARGVLWRTDCYETLTLKSANSTANDILVWAVKEASFCVCYLEEFHGEQY